MKRLITVDTVRMAVRLGKNFDPSIAQNEMAPNPRPTLLQNADIPPREAGVLALIYPEDDGELHVVLTRRAEHLRGHSGQISFPGGRRDPEDASFVATALRETCEELGICDDIEILGGLTSFYIPPSHFTVHPWVGTLHHKPAFIPNPYEVAEVFGFALHDLLNPDIKHYEHRKFNNVRVKIPYYDVEGHKVWGATAAMLGELEARLRMAIESA